MPEFIRDETRCDLVFCRGRRASVAPHFHRNCWSSWLAVS